MKFSLPLDMRKKRIEQIKKEIKACNSASKGMSEFLHSQVGAVIRHAVIGLISTISVSVMAIKIHRELLEADLRKEEGNVKRIQSRKRLRAGRK